MDDKKKDIIPSGDDFLLEEPPLDQESIPDTPDLILEAPAEQPVLLSEIPEEAEEQEIPALEEPQLEIYQEIVSSDEVLDFTEPAEPVIFPQEQQPFPYSHRPTREASFEEAPYTPAQTEYARWSPPMDADATAAEEEPVQPSRTAPQRILRKGRPKRKKGYGFFGIPHLLATVVWLAIIVMIGTSLGRMIWVCAADVLAFGRESKQVSVTITSHDTIDDIAEKLHDAELIRYPEVFKLYAKLAVDDGDILPGTFQLNTIYDYHALVVQMGPRSSTRSVVEDVLIPEGMNCRQIFELLEEYNVCTVEELEEYAANGEFADFWFLEGVERGDKYCLEGYLFPDTYDFYEHSTPREALGKMLLGFQSRINQEEITTSLAALNERLSNMMRANGCSDEFIADNQLTIRELLTVASLIEEETSSAKESATIASVIFNRYTQDQLYERYLNIDAAIIYATGDANNIDTSIDHPYNTYKYPGLTPGPISNPGLDSIKAALNFEDTQYYYYVLNPETGTHQFSKTLEEHEKWVEEFQNYNGGEG